MAKTRALAAVGIQAAVDRVNALLPAANAGDQRALAELRAVLDGTPALWEQVGDLGRQAELALVRAAAGDNPVARQAVLRKLGSLRREIAGPAASPIERLLAERVALGWLGVAVAEGAYHRALEGGVDRSEDEFHQRRVERAQRRYLAAIKALAQVRRLGVPSVQVNIGGQQVNVAD